jgi:colanic acid biosynthesis protein WcaH
MRPELAAAEFAEVVRLAPLVSIDLIASDRGRRVLLGLRRNPPAAGSWFVPGGRIHKGEPLETALVRLGRAELGARLEPSAWQFGGVAEHFYEEDFAGQTGMGTHYVVLAYRAVVEPDSLQLPAGQHLEFRWWEAAEILRSEKVHPYARAYFSPGWGSRNPSG